MKLCLLFITMLTSVSCFSQTTTMTLRNGNTILASSIFRTDQYLYYYMGPNDSLFKIPASEVFAYPVNTKLIKELSPEGYLMQFRKEQLTSIWLTLLGAGLATIGAVEDIKPLTYAGIGTASISFFINVNSFRNIKRRYIIMEAKEKHYP